MLRSMSRGNNTIDRCQTRSPLGTLCDSSGLQHSDLTFYELMTSSDYVMSSLGCFKSTVASLALPMLEGFGSSFHVSTFSGVSHGISGRNCVYFLEHPIADSFGFGDSQQPVSVLRERSTPTHNLSIVTGGT